jgi:hypothetical protein
MSNGSSGVEPSDQQQDLRRAGDWLTRHGLADARPTPLLATRLAARRQARRGISLLLAALVIGASLTQAYDRITTARFDQSEPHSRTPLVVLAAFTVAFVVAQSIVDGWVRRVDRRAAATLSRRVAHPVPPRLRTVLGRPYATFAVAIFAAAAALAASALTVSDSTVRFAAAIVLIGLAGIAVSVAVQVRDILARPVVAEDEESLTADVIMRVEDARERTAPSVVWALPVLLLFGDTLGWWNAASLILAVGASVALHLLRAKTPPVVTVARQAMIAR